MRRGNASSISFTSLSRWVSITTLLFQREDLAVRQPISL
jgi:hypothetical protein